MMKRLIVLIGVLLCSALILLSADDKHVAELLKRKTPSAHCVGFTILEAGKGINCHGDTIALVKVNGYYSTVESEHGN